MLKDLRSHTTLPAADLQRAKTFYAEKLGLAPISELPGGLLFEMAGGTRFLLYPTPNPNRGGHTQMGFTTSDIAADVGGLVQGQ